MPANVGTNLIAPIVPNFSTDVFPTHEAIYGLGGLRTVNLSTDLTAIPIERREEGMLVYVKQVASYYKLASNLTTFQQIFTDSSVITPTGSDQTAQLQALIDSGTFVNLSPGTFLHTGLTLRQGTRIIGSGFNTILFLINGSNKHGMFAQDCSDILLQDFKIDCNQANQSIGSGHDYRAIYFFGQCYRLQASRVWVANSVDHGFFISGNGFDAGLDSTFSHMIASGCGSAAHLAAGGAGGTGMVGGVENTTWVGCHAHDNYLNGFKSATGTWIGCHAYNCVGGGGFETGFSSASRDGARFIGCTATSNFGGGFRHQGQGDKFTMIGCEASTNGSAGVTIINTVNKAIIDSCYIYNNNQSGNPRQSGSTGQDGVSILFTTGVPTDIRFSGNKIFDDQMVPTQQYGIYVDAVATGIKISENNEMSGNALGSFFMTPTALSSTINIGNFTGHSANYLNRTPVTNTGTTSTVDLMTNTLKGSQFLVGDVVTLRMSGTVTGTAGTKIIRLDINGTTQIISNQIAAEAQEWACDVTFLFDTGTKRAALIRSYEVGGTSSLSIITVTASLSSDIIIKLTCTLGSAADSITQNLYTSKIN